jgi:hypothetical protein
MPINAPVPVTIPAKTFPHFYIRELYIGGLPDGKIRAQITFIPFNSETNEYDLRGEFSKTIVCEDVAGAAAVMPAVAQAYTAILEAADVLLAAAVEQENQGS